jgi:hypothetical protein
MPKHYVFLFRHCVRSTKKRERLHNNWTATQSGQEQEYETLDFVAEGLPDWQAPDYACTGVGRKAMEGTGRQLFRELVDDLMHEQDQLQKLHDPEEPRRLTIQFQLLVDNSQRDVDSALALQRGLLKESNDETLNPYGAVVVLKGLDRMDFYPDLFHPSQGCPEKLSSSTPFQDVVRKEVERQLETLESPTPDLLNTLAKLEHRGGTGRLGSIQQVPIWIPGPNDAESKVNTTSQFPVVISDGEIYLAGPINLVSWMAELAFYSRAGGIHVPFLWNLTMTELYRLVEFYHWSRAVLSVENSIAARRGIVLGQAILEALRRGHISIPGRPESVSCSTEDDSPDIADAKVTLIVGHDGDMDAIATAFGLRWVLPSPYHTSPGNDMGEYVPTPPASAMQFVMDKDESWVDMSYRFPIMLERFHNTTGVHIPKGMRMNSSGILEATPMVIQPRGSSSWPRSPSMDVALAVTRTIMAENGLSVLQAQLEDTMAAFPESGECYQGVPVGSSGSNRCESLTRLSGNEGIGHHVPVLMTYGLLFTLGGLFYLLGFRLRRDGGHHHGHDRCAQISPAPSLA